MTITAPPAKDSESDWSAEVANEGPWQQPSQIEPLCQRVDCNTNTNSNPSMSLSVYQVAVLNHWANRNQEDPDVINKGRCHLPRV